MSRALNHVVVILGLGLILSLIDASLLWHTYYKEESDKARFPCECLTGSRKGGMFLDSEMRIRSIER